jgi:hypothetical protein
MSAFPNSPRLIKGGIVLVDPDSGAVQKIIVLQYNPDTFNTRYKVATDKGLPHDEAMIEAARKTKTGDWAKAVGFNNIKITKSEGSPGAFTNVEGEFTK